MNTLLRDQEQEGDERVRPDRHHAVLTALAAALDARDDYDAGRHSTATAELARNVGERLAVGEEELELVSQVAVLHDLGKLWIPRELLRKTDPLDDHERALIREHPVIGQRIVSGIPGLDQVASAIRHEHERWDGAGYPDGLSGEQIPLVSRIVFACDAWHAMTSDRPYRPAMPHDRAVDELRAGAGSQFDPRVAEALLEIVGDDTPPPLSSETPDDRRLSGELEALVAEVSPAKRLAEELEVLRDENARLVAQLRTDALTGVASRSAWDEALGSLEWRRGDEPLSVVVVDVDGLKTVNDEAGHAAGDALLRRCAQLLARSVRSGDMVARIGGDEFGVLLRGADEAQISAWCDRLDRDEARSWSIGWASVPPADSLSDAVAKADRRMYERKLARRVARN